MADAKMTYEDYEKLNRAMRKSQFRDLLSDYVDEISNRKHKKEQEEYMLQVEEQGEMPKGCVLVKPDVGCCIKLDLLFPNGLYQKCYLNVCHSQWLLDIDIKRRTGGSAVDIPFSVSPPRPDKDRKGSSCLTFDVCVSTTTYRKCEGNGQLLRVLVETCIERINSHYLKGNERIQQDFQVLPHVKCKGGTPPLLSLNETLVKDRERFRHYRREDIEKRRKEKQEAGTTAASAVTPKDLKKLVKKAKTKTQVVSQQPRCPVEDAPDETAAEDTAAAAATEPEASDTAGKEAVHPLRHGVAPESNAGSGTTQQEEEGCECTRENAKNNVKVLKPGESRIIHQGILDLADLFGSHSTLPMHKPVPDNLNVEINVGPWAKTSQDMDVSVDKDQQRLKIQIVRDGTNKELDILLPYPVDFAKGTAQFTVATQHLKLLLPVDKPLLRDREKAKPQQEQVEHEQQRQLQDAQQNEQQHTQVHHQKRQFVEEDQRHFCGSEHSEQRVDKQEVVLQLYEEQEPATQQQHSLSSEAQEQQQQQLPDYHEEEVDLAATSFGTDISEMNKRDTDRGKSQIDGTQRKGGGADEEEPHQQQQHEQADHEYHLEGNENSVLLKQGEEQTQQQTRSSCKGFLKNSTEKPELLELKQQFLSNLASVEEKTPSLVSEMEKIVQEDHSEETTKYEEVPTKRRLKASSKAEDLQPGCCDMQMVRSRTLNSRVKEGGASTWDCARGREGEGGQGEEADLINDSAGTEGCETISWRLKKVALAEAREQKAVSSKLTAHHKEGANMSRSAAEDEGYIEDSTRSFTPQKQQNQQQCQGLQQLQRDQQPGSLDEQLSGEQQQQERQPSQHQQKCSHTEIVNGDGNTNKSSNSNTSSSSINGVKDWENTCDTTSSRLCKCMYSNSEPRSSLFSTVSNRSGAGHIEIGSSSGPPLEADGGRHQRESIDFEKLQQGKLSVAAVPTGEAAGQLSPGSLLCVSSASSSSSSPATSCSSVAPSGVPTETSTAAAGVCSAAPFSSLPFDSDKSVIVTALPSDGETTGNSEHIPANRGSHPSEQKSSNDSASTSNTSTLNKSSNNGNDSNANVVTDSSRNSVSKSSTLSSAEEATSSTGSTGSSSPESNYSSQETNSNNPDGSSSGSNGSKSSSDSSEDCKQVSENAELQRIEWEKDDKEEMKAQQQVAPENNTNSLTKAAEQHLVVDEELKRKALATMGQLFVWSSSLWLELV